MMTLTAYSIPKVSDTHRAGKGLWVFRGLQYLFIFFFFILSSLSLRAQDVTVTVTPTQSVLPPQLMLYITEPANYFNISLSNTGKDNANVYLVMQVEQVNPSSGLSLSTPPRRQPKMPIVVPAGGTRILTPAEVRGLFNHIPLNEINAPTDLFSNYTDGSFGLLPEGDYELHFTAYRWDPNLTDPVVASSPTGGYAHFSVCYKAQAPEFLTPVSLNGESLLSVAELDPLSPQFTWKAPIVACNPTLLQYTYSIRIIELLAGQFPDEAMDHNPVLYQVSNLITPLCMIPQPVIKQMKATSTYAAQVTAYSANSNNKMLNYVSIANDGKSTYKLFRLKPTTTSTIDKQKSTGDGKEDQKKDEDEDEDDKEENPKPLGDEIEAWMADTKTGVELTDSLYTFRNPRIIKPVFSDNDGIRKLFIESPIMTSWERCSLAGGEGQRSDTISIEYDVELFNNGERADMEDALKKEPIYKAHLKTELKDSIPWDDIAEDVSAGDYMVLRVTPVVKEGESVGFTGNDNVIDFAMCKRLSREYFQCQSRVEIEDTKPTSKNASDLKGKTVTIGEYNLTIDEVKGSGSEGFTGTGRVEWQPFGSSLMVCVKFNKLKINQSDVVYDGICESVANPDMMSSMDVVDKLFSDWGIDNLIGESGIPYASQLEAKTTGTVKSLAEKINLGDYYKKVQDGKALTKLLTTGKMDKLYMPIKFPADVLQKGFDAVDLQIVDMKFAPTYATMNILGQSTMPECDVLKSKVLVFGAPRVCISPDSFLPEDGHVALLGDFTITPSNDFELTFKAPKNVLEPHDGCYISWHKGKLELLGIDADMKMAGMVKDVNGKATTERPVMNLTASFGSWNDFLVDNISVEDFQLEDLPGWTFRAKDIVYDHSDFRNSSHMSNFPKNYSKEKAGIKGEDELWHGLHIGSIGVAFPTSLELNSQSDKSDKRLWVEAKEMFIDQSGVTVTMSADSVFEAKEGTLGGWGISLNRAHLQIIQNDFDNCGFSGQINIPILDRPKNSKNKDDFGNVDYSCLIRRLTNPLPDKQGKVERTRYSYVFLTEQIDDLDFSFILGQATLNKDQTYFVVEAYDDEKKEGKINTQVELCLGGEIGIGLVDNANDWLKKKTEGMPLELKIPDIHFTKMRLSNVQRSKWVSSDERVEAKRLAREEKEAKEQKAALKVIMESNELNIGSSSEPFYFDLGEWSLASDTKYLGPFSFNLDKFQPSFENDTLTVELGGTVGLVEDMINVGATVAISAKVNTPGTDFSKWSIEDGNAEFRKLNLDLDFTALHLKGELEATTKPNKGYSGKLDIGIIGFFDVKCEGGYYEHKAKEEVKGDQDYAWGYFLASLETEVIRVDPIVINRISGGFFFNCKPTPGTDKFNGKPKEQHGCIGIAFGLGINSSAGKEALNADLDMLVVYDTDNTCFSTFMLNGELEAVSGMIKANCSLIYENEKDIAGRTRNRYLCLNVTMEAGLDTNTLKERVIKANDALAALKDKMNEFQSDLQKSDLFKQVTSPMAGLGALAEDNGLESEVTETDDKAGITAGELEISLEFKVTWVKDGTTYRVPKWHLYLGEPDEKLRCRFTLLKFDSKIVSVDIGADGYLCLGNELPNGGALPEIPSKITKFLNGNSNSRADMGADLDKVQRSRKNAAKALLDPSSLNGGVMVGAKAWGYINLDLGLLYGSLDAIAGFDAALVNYGNNAFCVNSGSEMGYEGWYAMGQLYAYLAAELGVHIHIGSFINEKISIINAGIGGVLETGLPNPTWMEGAARIKVSLLGGLCKINKKFDFSAGEHCVPFKGNALDGFEMFQGVSHGTDSLYQAIIDPNFDISLNEAKNMTFTTQSSIGSHYRLLDPSWESELKDKDETTEEALEKSMALNASRTYVFDIDQNLNTNGMKMGVRLFDLGEDLTRDRRDLALKESFKGKQDLMRSAFSIYGSNTFPYKVLEKFLYKSIDATVNESSLVMEGPNQGTNISSRSGERVNMTKLLADKSTKYCEVDCSFREEKGTTFHLTNMDVEPGHLYMLVLAADAYEIQNGRRVWCEYHNESLKKNQRIHWQQTKTWFFRVKSDSEEKIVEDSLRNLEPYIALAYPSYNGTRVRDERAEGEMRAYFNDILHPTIALNRDISASLPANKMQWVLEGYTAAGDTLRQTKDAAYRRNGNCINLEPDSVFKPFKEFTSAAAGNPKYDFSKERYRLYLTYTYNTGKHDSIVYLVNLPLVTLPHNVKVKSEYYTDSWQVTTNSVESKELLSYSRPFVGACVDNTPSIDYEKDYTTKNLTDEDLVFKNTLFAKYEKPYRLIDPYMYFAYLGKWVFIGDREINTYAFDNVPVKFGSESLIFNYNGTTVNSEFLLVDKNKKERNKSLIELREKMYNVWNTWAYNNDNQPEYPLPSIAQTVGGLTANNQDGKASTVTPLNVNYYSDYTYVFEDLVKDYTAVYGLADQLCEGLQKESEDLLKVFFTHYHKAMITSGYKFDDLFNSAIKQQNALNRGRYLEYKDRDYAVRVPYYQLPLIFGACFGSDGEQSVYASSALGKLTRSFDTSIGTGNLTSGTGDDDAVNFSKRCPASASNLLFFRLSGAAGNKKFYFGNTSYPVTLFNDGLRSTYANSYESAKHVARDRFDYHAALKAVTGFKARIYRVDSYDITKGLYVVSDKDNRRGGGPWETTVNIGADNKVASNLDVMVSGIEYKDEYLETHHDVSHTQAIWCDDTKTLMFNHTNKLYRKGDKLNTTDDGCTGTVTWIYYDDDVINKNWHISAIYDNCTQVVVRSGFTMYGCVKDLSHWFEDFSKATSITGARYLASKECTDMKYMFAGCASLTDLELKDFYTTKVTSMSHMFDGCKKLKSLDLSSFETTNVIGMTSMFENCEALTSVNLSSFTGESLQGTSYMFSGCKSLGTIDIRNLGGDKLDNSTEKMFAGCSALRKLYIDVFDPHITLDRDLANMFQSVSTSLTTTYFASLDNRIVKQIPGSKKTVPDNRAKVIHGRYANGDEALFFVLSTTNYVTGKEYTLTINGEQPKYNSNIRDYTYEKSASDHKIKVVATWTGDDVLNTGTSAPKWKSAASKVTAVYVDMGFTAHPKSTAYWFQNFSNLSEVQGMRYLNTDLVTSMKYMFAGCSKIMELQLGKISVANGGIVYPSSFKTDNVTSMEAMFMNCSSLKRVITLGCDLSKVTSMYNLFSGCKSLTNISTMTGGPAVTDMDSMFKGCSSLESVGKMQTDKVRYMNGTFQGCSSLTEIPTFSSTANVNSMNSMFSGCSKLKTINFNNVNTAKVTDMSYIFQQCSSAEEINVCEVDASSLSKATSMFYGVPSKCYIYIASDATKIVNVCPESSWPNRVLITPSSVFVFSVADGTEIMFYGKRTTLKAGDRCNISPYDGYTIYQVYTGYQIQNRTEEAYKKNSMWSNDWRCKKVVFHQTFSNVKVMNAYGYLRNMDKLTTIVGLDNLDLSKAKDLSEMFYNCQSLSSVNGTLKIDNATKMVRTFCDCKSLKNLDFIRWGTDDKLTDMKQMCFGCTNLTTLGSSGYYYPHTANVTDMSSMFRGCSKLTSVPTAKMNTSKVTNMSYMFYNCSSLSDATLKGLKDFDTKQVTDMSNMLYGVNSTTLDLSTWNTGNVKDMSGWLAKNTSLRKLTLGTNFDLGKVEKYKTTSAFDSNHDMTVITPKAKLSSIKTAFTSKLGFVIGTHGVIDDDTPKEVAQVIWTKGNKTLTFYYGNPVGSTFNSQTVTQKWSGDDVLSNASESAKWSSTVKNDVTTVTFDKTFSNARPTSTKGWFWGCSKLKTINGLENLTTCYSVKDMSYMFYGCTSLTELIFDNSLPRWTTDYVTDMSYMFYNCSSLKKISLTRFNGTGKVTSMRSMFSSCSALQSLDLSMFKTTSVTNADYMFNYMVNLRTLTVGSDFTFPKISSKTSYTFSNVKKCEVTATSTVLTTVKPAMVNKLGFIEKVDGVNGDFVASDKKKMQAIWTESNKTLTFYYGKQYTKGGTFRDRTITNVWTVSADGGSPWRDTVKKTVTTVTIDETMAGRVLYSLASWFQDCTALTTINGLTNLSTAYTKSYNHMFSECTALTKADVSEFMTKWSGSSVYTIDLRSMFYNCQKLATIDVSKWSADILSHVTDMSYMFWNCKAVTKLDVSKWNTSKVKTMRSMFCGCENLSTLDMSKWNTINVTNMAYMFYNCKKAYPNCGTFDTGNVTDMSYMFYNAAGGTPSKDVSKVTNMAYMFAWNSRAASSSNLEKWNTSNVTNMNSMFFECNNVKRIYVSKWNVSKVTNMGSMFHWCKKLEEWGESPDGRTRADLTGWNTPALTNMNSMFSDCESLMDLNLSSFNLSKVTDMSYCFSSCHKLSSLDLRLKYSTYAPTALTRATLTFIGVGRDINIKQVRLNKNFRVTNKMTEKTYIPTVTVNDCDSGINNTMMAKTLKNMGAETANGTYGIFKEKKGKVYWYNDSDPRKGSVPIFE